MQYYRCKCGNAQAWGSDSPAACDRCSKCGSDLAQSPSEHREPKPHEFLPVYDDTARTFENLHERIMATLEREDIYPDSLAARLDAIVKAAASEHDRCRYCHRTRVEIERRGNSVIEPTRG